MSKLDSGEMASLMAAFDRVSSVTDEISQGLQANEPDWRPHLPLAALVEDLEAMLRLTRSALERVRPAPVSAVVPTGREPPTTSPYYRLSPTMDVVETGYHVASTPGITNRTSLTPRHPNSIDRTVLDGVERVFDMLHNKWRMSQVGTDPLVLARVAGSRQAWFYPAEASWRLYQANGEGVRLAQVTPNSRWLGPVDPVTYLEAVDWVAHGMRPCR